jgi:uncharacterized membrane protein YkoI
MMFAAVLMLSGTAMAAKTAVKCKETAPGLSARAKLTCDEARKKALSLVKKGSVQSAELEEEKGKLVYSFDLKQRGKSGIEEVQIDAVSGDVVSQEHESPKSEAAERDGEKSLRGPR